MAQDVYNKLNITFCFVHYNFSLCNKNDIALIKMQYYYSVLFIINIKSKGKVDHWGKGIGLTSVPKKLTMISRIKSMLYQGWGICPH